ncbi:MAG: hypothetical protein RL227_2827 [Pseudomonadota bacterium]
MEEVFQAPQVAADRGSETMLALRALGRGTKRISRELGWSRNTVRDPLESTVCRISNGDALSPRPQWPAAGVC